MVAESYYSNVTDERLSGLPIAAVQLRESYLALAGWDLFMATSTYDVELAGLNRAVGKLDFIRHSSYRLAIGVN